MSPKAINFHDFATYFKEPGCRNALDRDGVASWTYLPGKGLDAGRGNLGVMIAVVAEWHNCNDQHVATSKLLA